MKIRPGFVSNSSSSSFIIAVAPNKEINTELIKFIIVDETENPFLCITNEIVGWFIDNVEEINKEDFLEGIEYYNEKIIEAFKNGWRVYTGSACDDGNGEIENLICDMSISYNNKNIIIEKDGGY